MQITKIPTEDPIQDQWQLLDQFAYPANIRKYLQQHQIHESTTDLCEFIAGCISQAGAYFQASIAAPLFISPLLLYYGATNLMIGAGSLLTGIIKPIGHHGITLLPPEGADPRIRGFQLRPCHPKNGALTWFCEIFSNGCPITSHGMWSLEEILASVPDLKNDFERCYDDGMPFIIPVELQEMEIDYKGDGESRSLRIFETVALSDVSRFENPVAHIKSVSDFASAYMNIGPPQKSEKFIRLNRRMRAEEIGFYNIYGKKFLELPHLKNQTPVTLNQLIILFLGLFALGHISRYSPHAWYPFVRADSTGERLIVQKFLSIANRYIPNLVLNFILRSRIEFFHPGSESRLQGREIKL